ncbi:type I-E CRISPR-associated protein Cas7/Cse4/CasC [Gordonia spumicola]|uniref:Type I-E CRISPR-associated protein Cas7/Cse4/CasC n=1 Tax=Gordonia spumicola TaxID=589161 RepID=A0A7I9VEV6_9ACTN|nr:type I-E CRISPR-associated protein Cas7/Cse4/CasC [Gordonia spumicola]GEE03854.1 type I-E CRISPR-associated protein Cas7/Cse4/CasC [Gordonia spumicola]
MSLFIDFHAIHPVPPANINRDEDGSPKTTVFGGSRRARVSSQAWKRAMRHDFAAHLDDADLGVRTLKMVEVIADRVQLADSSVSDETAQARAIEALTAAGIKVEKVKPRKGAEDQTEHFKTGALLFLSNPQIDALAALAAAPTESIDKKDAKAVLKRGNSIDLALFGRMIADAPDINVDAAAQVAHAIGTHAVVPEFDYFTAVDDRQSDDNAGAGMIGTVEFNTATLYRYATVNVTALGETLGSTEAAARGVEAFTRSFVTSMPTGKRNTFANNTLPSFVLATVRTDQPISFAAAFEKPVDANDRAGLSGASIAALMREADALYTAYDAAPAAAYVVSTRKVDDAPAGISITDLISKLGGEVRDRLGDDK